MYDFVIWYIYIHTLKLSFRGCQWMEGKACSMYRNLDISIPNSMYCSHMYIYQGSTGRYYYCTYRPTKKHARCHNKIPVRRHTPSGKAQMPIDAWLCCLANYSSLSPKSATYYYPTISPKKRIKKVLLIVHVRLWHYQVRTAVACTTAVYCIPTKSRELAVVFLRHRRRAAVATSTPAAAVVLVWAIRLLQKIYTSDTMKHRKRRFLSSLELQPYLGLSYLTSDIDEDKRRKLSYCCCIF